MNASTLLSVKDLVTRFHTDHGTVRAVNGVSFDLQRGEALGIVGESGSGKSVTALSMLGLIQGPAGEVARGSVRLNGRELTSLSRREWRAVRGREIGMVFQDPSTSLNPVLTVGYQLMEAVRHHEGLSKAAAADRAAETLELVGIPNPRSRLSDYPHQFSGGQRQRVMIAMALALEPDVLIADEPTTALDVTIQAQVVELVQELRGRLGMAIIWITHDLGLVAGLVDRVLVMYAGRVAEEAPVRDIFERPAHPYTRGLLAAMPSWDDAVSQRLEAIEGQPPDLTRIPAAACAFAPRCPLVAERCLEELPGLLPAGPGRSSACWRLSELTDPPPTVGA